MKKKSMLLLFASVIIFFLTIATVNYRKSNPVVKINRNKVSEIMYVHEIERNKIKNQYLD